MYWFRKSIRKVYSFSSLSTSRIIPALLMLLTLLATLLLTSTTHANSAFGPITPSKATEFNGKDAYITFGDAPELNLSAFTLELWFKWTGGGSPTDMGFEGISAYPLLAKGRGEGGDDFLSMNYFLGINAETHVLVADLAGRENGPIPSLNHPIFGETPIIENEWNHAAATFDGYQWHLYLNGKLESVIITDQAARIDGLQHASLATALNSAGTPSGFFAGALDEARIWDVALSEQEIRKHINAELSNPQPHLVARWGLDGSPGRMVTDSAGQRVDGTAVSIQTTPTVGAPFNLIPNDAPDAPTLVQPGDTAVNISSSPTLEVSVSDSDADSMTVKFYGRPLTTSGNDFTLVALPDTQKYAASSSRYHIFNAQTQWVVDNKTSRNVAHVTQLGDCVDDGGDTDQWDAADFAFSILEDPNTTGLPDGISYSIAVGNKDQSPSDNPNGTALYNQYFGSARFIGREYYGGFQGSNFDNHYELFSAGGMDFILISLEYGGSTSTVLNWADALLTTYSDRRAIVVTHYMIGTNNNFGGQGQDIYDALKGHSNLFMLHGGHKPGEGRREDTFNGNKVHSLLADYQSRSNGGDGWLRILEFSPSHNEIRVKTYSPTRDEFETDSDSEFTLDYDMQQSAGMAGFQLIGTVSGVASGSNASVTWPNLDNSTEYEWYATVDDGTNLTTGDYWSFTTEDETPTPPVADFSGDVLLGFAPLTVNFSDLSSANPTSWSWDFGDSGSSTDQNPSHTYNTPGIYDVALTVANSAGNDAETKVGYIEVQALPTADLGITKADLVDPIDASEAITYTISVTNNGPETAPNVVMTDTLPGGMVLNSATPEQGTCSETGGIVTCDLNTIPNGDSVNITVVATATIGGVITNNVSVSGDVIDSNGNNDTASEETTVYQTIATQTFSPIHDAYVKLGNGSNYGSDTRLRLRDGSPDYDSYLKFDLSTLAGPVESATLRLYIDSNGNNSSSVYSVSNDYEGTSTPWEEMALNGNNAPVWSGSPLDTVGPGTNGEWLEWDVTNALTDPATYSFAISTNSSNSVYYNSSENGSNQPELVVNVNVCTPPVAVADMVASTDGTAVTLNWTGAADQYEIWIGNNDPYFAPGNDCAAATNCELITPPPAEYIHATGAGDTAVNHSYIILAVNNCTASSVRSGNSNRTGAFDFAIQPGS